MSAKRHPVTLDCTRSPEQIGKDLAKLRFDVMLVILRAWWQELSKQAFADRKRGRHQLAQALFDAADRFGPVMRCLDQAWRISKPYMKHELRVETRETTRQRIRELASDARSLADAMRTYQHR